MDDNQPSSAEAAAFWNSMNEECRKTLVTGYDGIHPWSLAVQLEEAGMLLASVPSPDDRVMCVAEEDVDRMIPYLRERGIEPLHPPTAPVQGPMTEPIVHGWMPAAAVFFKDPDGHLLELVAELSDPPRPDFLYRPLSEWRTLVGKVLGLPEIAGPTP